MSTAAPPADRISVVVLEGETEIESTRRMGTCTRVPGVPSMRTLSFVLVNPDTSREFVTSGIVAPATSLSQFVGLYEAPDTGETGTGTGSQTTTRFAVTRLAAEGGRSAARKGGTRSAKKSTGKGAVKSTKGKGGAKKGKK